MYGAVAGELVGVVFLSVIYWKSRKQKNNKNATTCTSLADCKGSNNG